MAALGFAGCAQQPQHLAANSHSKEYFPASVYGAASRRVIESGPIPHGGGQYLVGKPYTVAGHTYYPSERRLAQVGYASWYGDAFHGRLTANGEIYDRNSFTAAHPTMPLPSYARVTNLRNKMSMIVRVNDRGPFASNRIMDVSRGVAEALRFQRSGTAKIKVEYVGRASLAGSDDARLYATLRVNGPARWDQPEPTMVAEAEPPPPIMAPPPPRRVREAMMPEGTTVHDPEVELPESAMPARNRPVALPRSEEARPVVLPRGVLERPVKEPPARVASFAREPVPAERPIRTVEREPERPSPRAQSASERALERILAAEEPVTRPRGGAAASARFEPAHVPAPAHALPAPTHVFAAPTHVFAAPTHVFAAPTHVFAAPTHVFAATRVMASRAEPAPVEHVRPEPAWRQGERVPGRLAVARAPLPPARPMDLGTIPGAGSAIGAPRPPRDPPRFARSRDD